MGNLWHPDGTEALPEALTRPFDRKVLEKLAVVWEREAKAKQQQRQACAAKWHPGSKEYYKILTPSPRLLMYCQKCDTHYERGLTLEEWKDYDREMRTFYY